MRRRLLVSITLLALLCAAASAQAITIPVGAPAIDTTITGGPLEGATTEDETPSFSFTATSNGNPFATAVFQCSVDGEPAEACTSPFQLPSLEEEGEHTFSVFAEDPESADRDPSPATRSFFFFTAEEEECEAGEFEDEEGNVEECEASETGPVPPPECLLRTARARLFAYTTHEKVRLAVRYTSYAPSEVDVEYRLGSGKGSLKLGDARGHFAKRGLFHLTEKLDKAAMAKVRAAKHFTVELDVAGAPSLCRRYETRQLTVKRNAHGQTVWLQSGSAFGSGS